MTAAKRRHGADGRHRPWHTPATPGVFSIVENATITGGTGRFAGATGSSVVERSVDLTTRFTTGSLDGVITY